MIENFQIDDNDPASLRVKNIGAVQKSPSSKATGTLAPEAYTEYVRTTKARERRWRTFSTAP